jgi:hypothetical protein
MEHFLPAYVLHFSGAAWSQIGSLEASHFEALQNTLEHFAVRAYARLQAGAFPRVDERVPIAAGRVVAECTFDDHSRSITVEQLEYWDRSGSKLRRA